MDHRGSGRCGRPLVALICALAAVALLACGPSSKPRSAQRPGGALSVEVRRKICATHCGGANASIRVFRDSQRRIGSLRFDGDLGRCSHPPSIYFDPRGRQLGIIPFKPLVKGSPEHRRILGIHARHTKGLKEAETVSCKP